MAIREESDRSSLARRPAANAAAEAGREDVSPGAAQPELGRALRRIRLERQYSLAEVAQATDISTSFLSIVENGHSDITIGRLMRLLAFYGVHVGDLLPHPPQQRTVTRMGEGLELRSPAEGVTLYLLAPDTDRTMMPVLVVREPNARIDNLKPHEGETFVYVLEGSVLFEREGEAPFVLRPGDAAYYAGNRPPTITTVGPETARLISVVSPPTL
jgi:transcriptional regulator with XRE-family HTH domain